MELNINTKLQGGKYQIKKILGQGSFGITYLAEYTFKHKPVAIKEFFMKDLNKRDTNGKVLGLEQGTLAYHYSLKFQKEALNLMELNHPNIINIDDFFEENNTFYYVMEYVDGENLNEYIQRQEINFEEATDLIKYTAQALKYMHEEKKMLHLDLKPGNIMRRKSDGHIFLIDFGLSKHFSENGQPDTSTTIGLGTPGYAPIEQGDQARTGEFRPTIDVYALGATYYKLITGQTPPEASKLVSEDTLISDNLKTLDMPDSLIESITKAMTPNTKKRTQNVQDFIADLPVFITTDKEDSLIDDGGEKEKERREKELKGRADHIFWECEIIDEKIEGLDIKGLIELMITIILILLMPFACSFVIVIIAGIPAIIAKLYGGDWWSWIESICNFMSIITKMTCYIDNLLFHYTTFYDWSVSKDQLFGDFGEIEGLHLFIIKWIAPWGLWFIIVRVISIVLSLFGIDGDTEIFRKSRNTNIEATKQNLKKYIDEHPDDEVIPLLKEKINQI